jgi:hypothetical protein
MCCVPGGHHSVRHWAHHGGSCACGAPSHCGPRFLTKEEKAAWLEQYLESLQQEAKVVQERIAKMKEEE